MLAASRAESVRRPTQRPFLHPRPRNGVLRRGTLLPHPPAARSRIRRRKRRAFSRIWALEVAPAMAHGYANRFDAWRAARAGKLPSLYWMVSQDVRHWWVG